MRLSYRSAYALVVGSCAASVANGEDMPAYDKVCQDIASNISNSSSVAFPGSAQYNASIWTTAPGDQLSACTVDPDNATELGEVLQVIAQSDVPFGLKSGGHAHNQNFSSTPGVLITTSRFTEITFDADLQTVSIGAGQIWSAVYAVLEAHNVTAAGGRSPTVGVGGLIAGGGYSFIANEVGLGIDTVVGYEVVLPNGTVSDVNATTDPQLFWALKGSGNNFGVITRVTMRTFPMDLIWGGDIVVLGDHLNAVLEAFANYDSTVTDPKASVFVLVQRQIAPEPSLVATVTMHYSGASPPQGVFDEFLALPANSTDVSTRSFASLVDAQLTPRLSGIRAQSEQVPVNRYPLEVLHAWIAEVEDVAVALQNTSTFMIITVIETFNRNILTHAPPLEGFATPSAWPATREFPTFPSAFLVAYTDPADASAARVAITSASDHIRDAGAAAGVTETAVGAPDVAMYPNYAHWTNSPEEIYGSALSKLRELQMVYDPHGLMKRAGGFKFA